MEYTATLKATCSVRGEAGASVGQAVESAERKLCALQLVPGEPSTASTSNMQGQIEALQRVTGKPLLRTFVANVMGRVTQFAVAMDHNYDLEEKAEELLSLNALTVLRDCMPTECAVLRDYKALL